MVRGPLILGASGRLGRALRRVWPADAPQPLWQTRDGAGDTWAWDILNAAPSHLPPIDGIVVLAGVTHGDATALALNTALARACADLGAALGVRVLVASSQAVYGPQQGLLREDTPPAPASPYGAAKLAMERAVTGAHVTHLRIGNVAGCDALAEGIARGDVVLDRFADGQGPCRAMLTPADLAHVVRCLLAAPTLPPIVNVARPGSTAMADVLRAADVPFVWRDSGPGALPDLALDVTLLQDICPLPSGDAAAMAEALIQRTRPA
ncbi:NAD-dependent epimerase/dehydratase family protein [Loktanella fryxellensis]|nr:NAD-dependent epimerase/dehydratase family protein [Loktanella fryxellensis]